MGKHCFHQLWQWSLTILRLTLSGSGGRPRKRLGYLLGFGLALGLTLILTAPLVAQPSPEPSLSNQVTYTYSVGNGPATWTGSSSVSLGLSLVDPFGQLLGCGGSPLPNYIGFTVALYDPLPGDPLQSELGALVSLTPTELPNNPNNSVPGGLPPNITNANPYNLSAQGTYNFLFDAARGQVDIGRTYLLVVTPPVGTSYLQRRLKLQIIGNNGGVITYRATSLDGQPITATGATQIDQQTVQVNDAAQTGLQLSALNLVTTLCNSRQMQLTKSGDRAVAQPGDTVIYRVVVRNQTDIALQTIAFTDTLPLGFRLVAGSARAAIADQTYPVQVSQSNSTVEFQVDAAASLPVGEALSLVYAAQLTPDATRGTGRNSALVTARRSDTGALLRDGPASHRLRIDPGLLSDCGTLIGRVFEDLNFDGEQQTGEPGLPNAVIFLDDGNRITTDERGIFSLANVLPGYRSGTLDPLSVPGYELAPNRVFIERNSASRLVHLAPGSLVRMNFGVQPQAQLGGGQNE
ncbi:hypothetical protein VB780_01865 [Leptolyngbya sp. CCNP1308]|uniref:hypothetical protein n=1 Tax=Leptolyngbya sp. CCNP1308 TaxID=3110255 RepID=UPI002B2120B1|nr:hypothetical protein [Leptolyngbya sp. CCNP1308]MEA5447297.1 hypothetical protein [Leptolyngbya sp. CCNP1308]